MDYNVESWLSERGYETMENDGNLVVIDGGGGAYAIDTAGFQNADGAYRASADAIKSALTKSGVGAPSGYTPLRNTLAAGGATVGYDKASDAPIVNGQKLNTNDSRIVKVGNDYWIEKSFAKSFLPKTYENPYQKETNSILKSLANMQFSYDPKKDTALAAAQEEAMLRAKQSANSRGLLGGSTAEIMRQRAVQELVPQYEALARQRFESDRAAKVDALSILSGLAKNAFAEYEGMENLKLDSKKFATDVQNTADEAYTSAQETKDALSTKTFENELKKVIAMGVVDEAAAAVLGIPEGTLTEDAKQFVKELAQRVEEQNAKILEAEREWRRDLEFLTKQTDEKIRYEKATQ